MMKKLEELYEEDKRKEIWGEIKAMAERFGVTETDVVLAAWKIAKDTIHAQIRMDLRYKKEKEKYLREKEKEAKQ